MYSDGQKQINRLIGNLDEFILASKSVYSLLKNEDVGLNFKGYSSTLDSLNDFCEEDFEETFIRLKEILLWKSYLSEIRSLVEIRRNSIANQIDYLKAFLTDRENVKLNGLINNANYKFHLLNDYYEILDKNIKLLSRVYKNINWRYEELSKEIKRTDS